ncbi:hypothetical protein OS493_029451 [Desmophyllum pertusum]|uniref:Uncharacterized protein n=1 Tax=Desmophyllum pertusum TaxID=174260 RepID=A0A9W9YN29_9CNID|nr:hypothetical protein OS493_029451 [Desmophyllum pertusum]
MKWASTFSGELPNSAHYFSPFGNVSNDDKSTLGSLGTSADCTWKSWSYDERLKTAAKRTKYDGNSSGNQTLNTPTSSQYPQAKHIFKPQSTDELESKLRRIHHELQTTLRKLEPQQKWANISRTDVQMFNAVGNKFDMLCR